MKSGKILAVLFGVFLFAAWAVISIRLDKLSIDQAKTQYAQSEIAKTRIPTSTIKPTNTATPYPTAINLWIGCVNTDVLNIRSKPSINSEILGTFVKGDCGLFTHRDAREEWLRCDSGWVTSKYINLEGLIENLPILYEKIDSPPATSFIKTMQSGQYTENAVPNSCSCGGNYYNCDYFESQSSAQSCYQNCLNAVGYDVHKIDDDGDGIACELLP